MSDATDGDGFRAFDAEADEDHFAAIRARQNAHLRRILLTFLIVVALLPLVALGEAWSMLLVPLLVAAAVGLREAIRLRRSVRAHGAQR